MDYASPTSCVGCARQHAPCRCLPKPRKAVLLLNLGTPDSYSVGDVRRYLKEFLSDKYVIQLPRRWAWLTSTLGSLIARFRAPKSAHAYQKIWTDEGSPLKAVTIAQARALEEELPGGWKVYYAMRYANPSIKATVTALLADGITDLVVIPMYPQWAGPTTGTAMEVLYQELVKQGLRLNLTVRTDWYDDAKYIEAQAQIVHRYAQERSLDPKNAFLLFSTHSMPESYIKKGDPYEGQVRRSVELVAKRLGWPRERYAISFQSKLGPVKWLTPSTDGTLRELAQQSERDVMVCPISFTADCLETIEEIGMQYRDQFHEQGGKLHVIPALNTAPEFISALKHLVFQAPQRLNLDTVPAPALLVQSDDPVEDVPTLTRRLLCLSFELKTRLNGSGLSSSDFARVKVPQRETVDLLKTIHDIEAVESVWIWNTCQRFETYVVVQPGCSLDVVREKLKTQAIAGHGIDPVIRTRSDAWHHLLRVAGGLESRLPGDADVLEQLLSAQRMAEHAESLGCSGKYLLKEVHRLVEDVRQRTGWKNYCKTYSDVALPSFVDWNDIRQGSIVVIGGSSTTRSLLKTLVKRQNVKPSQIVVVYRGDGRHSLVRELRQLLGNHSRLRVNRYDDPVVLDAVKQADYVFIGSDGRDPIMSKADLERLRDYQQRPLTIVDFNLYGSTDDLLDCDGINLITAFHLDAAVSQYADDLVGDSDYQEVKAATELLVNELSECKTVLADKGPLCTEEDFSHANAEVIS